MTLDQLVVTTVDVPTLVTTPSPGLAFSDPAYPLAGALRAIGCNCFSIRSVERYRDEVVRRAKREARQVENRIDAFEANLTWKPSDLLAGWLPVLLVCCYAGMLISIPVACVTTSILPFAVVGWGGTIGLLFGIAAAGLHSIQVIRTQRLAPAEVDAHRPVRHLDGLPHRQRPPPEGGLTGQVEWESMHDPTRPRTDWLRWPNPAAYIAEEMKGLFAGYRRNLIQSQPAYIELVSEKAAAQSICERAAMPFGVPVGVGRGYTSTACLADTARRFHESGKSHFIMLLSGDFDTEGENIVTTWAACLRDEHGIDSLDPYKLAVNKDQADEYELTPLKVKEKSKSGRTLHRAKKFIAKHGKKVFELEAFEPDVLQDIIRDGIAAVLDKKLFKTEMQRYKEDAREILARRRLMLDFMASRRPD